MGTPTQVPDTVTSTTPSDLPLRERLAMMSNSSGGGVEIAGQPLAASNDPFRDKQEDGVDNVPLNSPPIGPVPTHLRPTQIDIDTHRPTSPPLPPLPPSHSHPPPHKQQESASSNFLLLALCFSGIMFSFLAYGLLLEYATSGGNHIHELSFLFVTSLLYSLTARAGRYVRNEAPSTVPPHEFAFLGLTSMGSTYCSVASLKYVIYPIQILAKSCKPIPVMLFGVALGKRYPLMKFVKVGLIVSGVGLFMGGGAGASKGGDEAGAGATGIFLLFLSLCFDGGTGAYEDKLMSVSHVGPFDLMYNIQMGKTILAGVLLIVTNQVQEFFTMIDNMGLLLVALGLTGAAGQVFIFVTISKFGALTCSIIGLARKITTLVASIYVYNHSLNEVQGLGLALAVGSMVWEFAAKKKVPGDGRHGGDAAAEGEERGDVEKGEGKGLLEADEEDEDIEMSEVKQH